MIKTAKSFFCPSARGKAQPREWRNDMRLHSRAALNLGYDFAGFRGGMIFCCMPEAALNALLLAYQHQMDWLLAQADEFESGTRKTVAHMRGKEVDLTANLAAEYRHRALNMMAIMEAFERLRAKTG